MALGGMAFGVYLILGTASRGAAIALGCVVLYFLWHASPAQRLAAITVAPVGLVILLSILPQTLVQRIKSFSDTEGASEEALESSRSREYVLRKSIEYTLHNPIFGLGPGQFANYEGTHNVVLGGHGYWHSTHNCVTQASSEMGIPAALFMLGGFFSTMRSFRRVYRSTKFRPECRDINVAALTLGMAFVGFFVAIIFLNFAYFFYTPAMAGVAIALERVSGAELRLRKPEVPVPFPWQPRVAV
jgi:O-antigen ligase